MKYKIVFIDIDDTLNISNSKVTEYTKTIMKRLKEKGIIVVPNTGRSASYAIYKAKEAELSNYIISSNGAEVYDYLNKKIISNRKIPNKDIKEIYEYANTHNITMILNSLNERFINNKNYNYNNEPATYFNNIDEVLNNNEINQIVILSDNFDRMLVIPNLFSDKFPNLKIVHSSLNLIENKRVKNKEYYHDIVVNNTAKSTGIIELLDYLNLTTDDAIVVGNGYDDICMADIVKESIAVGNANNTLKEVSKYVADNVENDGAAKLLEHLLLADKS